MNFLFLGDIMGKSGRKAVIEHLPRLRDELSLDFVVANAENAAGGFGMTVDIAQDMFDAGVDVLTGGNHTFDKREVYGFIDSDTRVLRPINYPEGTPGQGKGTYELEDGRRVVIINALGRVFMNPLDDPFLAVENAIKHEQLGHDAQFIFVDIHAEATSEKMAMGQFLDGRVSLVVGTHSHVPTADAQILPNGTAYQTDAGMCGDYDSVIGMKKEEPIHRFVTKMQNERFTPATGPGTMCGVYVEADNATGLATRVVPVRLGGRLQSSRP